MAEIVKGRPVMRETRGRKRGCNGKYDDLILSVVGKDDVSLHTYSVNEREAIRLRATNLGFTMTQIINKEKGGWDLIISEPVLIPEKEDDTTTAT